MDPETLSVARLYAAIAIPQDVAQTVASRLGDADTEENPRDSDVLSIEPLSIRCPSSSTTDSSYVRSTPSISQTARSSQAGESADNPGDLPTIIRDSFPVAFSDEDLVHFRQYFSIPSFIKTCLPLEGEQVFEPLVHPSQSEGALSPGWTAVYIESLSYRLRFPFSHFIIIAVNRAPGQICPTG
ncbi:hypothetical protein LIER_29221 [Lithospermum erythrorhizon]|uniref:Uncharacterized protein n=1 Tax=Lithospermum erythrorhizon TaxID=34254 RepID=A0AAV3RLZ0_LITER